MGERGPPRKPTRILEARGSWLSKTRADGDGSLDVEYGRPICPNWLSKEAKRVWRYLIPRLDRMGILAEIDRNALVRYCQLFARWRKMEEQLDKFGESYPVKNEQGKTTGFEIMPQMKISLRLIDKLHKIEQQFGLTPAARARLTSAVCKPKEKEGEIIDKRKFLNLG